jgi:hypothetical protein
MSNALLLAFRVIMSNQARYSRLGTQLASTDGAAADGSSYRELPVVFQPPAISDDGNHHET